LLSNGQTIAIGMSESTMMREHSAKTVAIFCVALLLAGGQCIAFCSTAMCLQPAPQAGHPAHCHNHGGTPSHQKDSPNCSQHETFFMSGPNVFAHSAAHPFAAVPLSAEADRVAMPATLRSDEFVDPPRLAPTLVSTTVLRV
jgi:hypothetical protein